MSAATAQYRPSHRRDNNSISSSSGRGSEHQRSASTRSTSHPAVESAVTRLLVAIKQLLEALTQWSTLNMTETEVSDVYVRLGNDFNAAVAAFAAFNIDMSELLSVPDDLRNVLEQCLAEEATPDNLEIYLPTVRQIITNLLQGLRGKQSIYRSIVSGTRHRSSEQSGHDRSSRSSRREGGSGHRSQLSRTLAENERAAAAERSESPSLRRTSASARRKESASAPSETSSSAGTGDETFVGGFVPPGSRTASQDPKSNGLPERSNLGPSGSQSRKQAPGFPPPRTKSFESPRRATSTIPEDVATDSAPETPSSAAPQVPASVKRYSLVDKPAPPSVVVDEAEEEGNAPDSTAEHRTPSPSPPPQPETPPLDERQLQAPAVANSLAALKKSDALERRASKRFSTYNISKMTGMTGGATRDRSVRNQANRRSLLADGGTPTARELAALTEVDDDEEATPNAPSRRPPRTVTPIGEEVPPVPALPSGATTPEPAPAEAVAVPRPSPQPAASPAPEGPPTKAFPVFLQLGREVKKTILEPGLTFTSLRMVFVDKFSYNPGLENFPAIYIRDPSSGVQYELEDMDEVKEKCLLSLNIEPLDQIKQHIDAQISTLSQDIKELRSTVTTNRRASIIPDITAHPLAESTPAPNRPTDRQFAHVARRLSRLVGEDGKTIPAIQPQMTGQLQPQMTGGSVLSEYSTRVVGDLKTQFDEVQNLRRDLGIMRQLYTEFMKSTKESLGALRTQTQSVKQLATTNVGGARGYIDTGKTKLDQRSQNVLTKVEELQDTVETVKDDVLKRHMTPKPYVLQNLKRDVEMAQAELTSLTEHIQTIKPMWKKTWEEELHNIVEEQQFLHHQEEFLDDLVEDHKAVLEVFGHIEKVISIRGTTPGKGQRGLKSFKPPPPEEGHEGLNTVMMEIRGASVDPEKRMKAIAASQKTREKELASKSDEFQAELSGFVGGKKLKMTGGAEEAERVRQRRNDMTLKAMFTPSPTTSNDFQAAQDTSQVSPTSNGSG